ncbi:LacI family DNA-binding transcriptional regulator [Paenibacillus tarimensis]
MTGIKEVAKRANVSTATVSHVINGTRFVAEDTKIRVLKAMRELEYRPNSVARSLRSKRSKIIGLLVPILHQDTSNFFFMSVAQGIESVLMENGYNLLLSNSKEDVTVEQEQIKVFNSQLIDGLILAPTFDDHAELQEIKGDYPVVYIDRKPKEVSGDCVVSEGAKGTYEAIAHLIEKGHQKIGFITGTLGLSTSDERLAGYRNALKDYGIEMDDSLIAAADTAHSSFESGYKLAEALVTRHEITALFVANNVMTMGALHFLQSHDYDIPEQIAIIGFDDYEWTKITRPALTMVKQPSFDLGAEAARLILNRIEHPDSEFREIRLPTELIIRNSC